MCEVEGMNSRCEREEKERKTLQKNFHFQACVGCLSTVELDSSFLQMILTGLMTEASVSEQAAAARKKKKPFVDSFHFLLGPSPWQRSETGVPKCQRVCEGSYELWINPHRGSRLIIFGRPQSFPVSRRCHVDPERIHRLAAQSKALMYGTMIGWSLF